MAQDASSISSAVFALSFSRSIVLVWRARVRGRTVNHDDGEGEHDRRNHPSAQDQQGHYFG